MLWAELDRGYKDMWRELERLDRSMAQTPRLQGAQIPAADVWLTGDKAVVTIELPAMEPEAVDISIAGGLLTVSGEQKAEEAEEGARYHLRERRIGSFSRTFELPFTVDSEKVEARFSRGVLRITLPQIEAEKPRKISVMAH